jgi:hypothetical protein
MAFLRKMNGTTLALDEPVFTAEPAVKPAPKPAAKPGANTEAGPLFPIELVQDLRKRWDSVQTGFVDEPRATVRQADELVASAINELSESLAEARNNLERQWSGGDEADTEDLRVALKKYRSFFQKLMSV